MSVGHVARLLEAGGISTVILAAGVFRDRLAAMAVPRLLVTPHVMGRPVGVPGDRAGQRMVVMAALTLLQEAKQGGTIVEFAG